MQEGREVGGELAGLFKWVSEFLILQQWKGKGMLRNRTLLLELPLYWFSVNWKFALGVLAGAGFAASEITL